MAHAPTVLDRAQVVRSARRDAGEEERIEAELQEQADALIEKEVYAGNPVLQKMEDEAKAAAAAAAEAETEAEAAAREAAAARERRHGSRPRRRWRRRRRRRTTAGARWRRVCDGRLSGDSF